MRISEKRLALAVLVLGTFMAILDTSIVNIAIPKMMAVFNVGTDQIEWVLTSYMLTMAVVIPLTGFLGERFGLKRMYIFALATFTLGSLLCGLSWSLPTMIIARIIQAVGGGMIMPISMTLIYRIVPRHKIGLAMGFWGIAAMAAPAIGPTLGGYLIDYLNWQFIFNVNVPIGIIGVLSSMVLLDHYREDVVKPIDWGGAITIAVGLVTLLLALNNGNSDGWTSPYIVSMLSAAAISLSLFIYIELNQKEPLLDLSMLTNYPYLLSVIISIITTTALFGGIFMTTLYLQNLKGFSPIHAGLLMLPSSLATAVVMPISGRLFDKYGARPLVIAGMCILAYSTYLLGHLSLDHSYHYIMGILILRGVGMGFAMMPIQTYSMSEMPNHRVGKASALFNTFRQVSGTFGIALLSSFLVQRETFHYYRVAESLNLNMPNALQASSYFTQQALAHGLSADSARGLLPGYLYGIMMKQSVMQGIGDTFLVTFYLTLAGIVLSLFITKINKKPVAANAIVAE